MMHAHKSTPRGVRKMHERKFCEVPKRTFFPFKRENRADSSPQRNGASSHPPAARSSNLPIAPTTAGAYRTICETTLQTASRIEAGPSSVA